VPAAAEELGVPVVQLLVHPAQLPVRARQRVEQQQERTARDVGGDARNLGAAPKKAREAMELVFASDMSEVSAAAREDTPAPAKAGAASETRASA